MMDDDTHEARESKKLKREIEMFLPWSALKLWLILSVMFLTGDCSTCPDTCGGVQIPYPFGFGKNCSLSESFTIDCNNSNPNDVRPFKAGLEIRSIDLESSQVEAVNTITYDCYNSSRLLDDSGGPPEINLNKSPFHLSNKQNMFTAVGCDTTAYIDVWEGRNFIGGCISMCYNENDISNGSCSGIGCCQYTIPMGVKSYEIYFAERENDSDTLDISRCSYGFLVKNDAYNFSTSDLTHMDLNQKLPLVLDWAIGNITCEEAQRKIKDYPCVAENSTCSNSTNGPGYVCKCSEGYRGNPYVKNGCKDIDECKEQPKTCKGVCANTNGSYTCTCPPGTTGNATGDGCMPKGNAFSTWAKLGLGIGVGLPLIFIIGSGISWILQKKKLRKLKEEFFRQNGGLFLQEKISSNEVNAFQIFTMVAMEKATDRFDEHKILGKGGNGIVYKGLLNDGRTVAIKKSMMVETSKSKEFANEMLILSKINHVNVVKLLGCCLEVEVPLLVYEYIPNGTLFQHIHNERQEKQMSWDLRLRIGAQSAKALSYLHSEASPPILHGDIKSSNILLDDNFTAKVSDFGTSTFAPKDKSRFMTLIQGTYGYLDPEYLLTGELTEKSDVYSFGVVMVELLTGKKAVYKDEDSKEKNLVFEFISCMKEGRLIEILDPHIKDGNSGTFPNSSLEDIKVVADVVRQCLSVTGEERPTITQVYVVLEGLRKSETHPWVQQNMDESESLLTEEQKSQSSFKLDRNEDNRLSQPISTTELEIENIGRGR